MERWDALDLTIDTRIYFLSKIRFLGLTFQSDLGWTSYIKDIEKRRANSIRTLRCLCRTWKGADPNFILLLYRSLIRSRLEYAGFLFHNLTEALTSRLDKIQMKALRISLGYRASTSLNIILTEIRESLSSYYRFLCRNFISRASLWQDHPILPLLEELTERSETPTRVNKIGNSILIQSFLSTIFTNKFLPSASIPLCFFPEWRVFLLSSDQHSREFCRVLPSRVLPSHQKMIQYHRDTELRVSYHLFA